MGYRIHSIYQRVPTRLLAPSKLGGVRARLLRQESGKGCADSMGKERDSGREPRSDAVCVVYALQGGGRTSQGKQGGNGWRENVMYTLDATEVHAVCYGIDQQGGRGGQSADSVEV